MGQRTRKISPMLSPPRVSISSVRLYGAYSCIGLPIASPYKLALCLITCCSATPPRNQPRSAAVGSRRAGATCYVFVFLPENSSSRSIGNPTGFRTNIPPPFLFSGMFSYFLTSSSGNRCHISSLNSSTRVRSSWPISVGFFLFGYRSS